MQLKYKIAVMALIGILVLAIVFFPGTGETPEEMGTTPVGVEETEFKPTEDPYVKYLQARNEGRPILLEFYARY